MSQHVNRRKFVAGLVASSAAAPVVQAQQAPPRQPGQQQPQQQQVAAQSIAPPPMRRGLPPETPPFPGPITDFRRNDVPLKAKPFPMTQVRLLDGPCRSAQEVNRKVLQRLPADRLLHNFRVNAGLPTTAEPLGGWERPPREPLPDRRSELRGHYTGHFLSALALMHASTGDQELKTKGDFMVAELAKCQEKLGGGYLSAFPRDFWDRLDRRENVWAPFYTIHKIMAGMLDQYQLAGNKQALEVLRGMADWADNWTARHNDPHLQDVLNTEYGGMAETLYTLATITGEDRYAHAGDRYQKRIFVNPLALHRDELRGLHMNTHVPQVIAAAIRYEISGDYRFHEVADYFWNEVTGSRSYVCGGSSNGERWGVEPKRLAAELPQSVSTQECCCAYNMMKLTRHLYSWTADPRYFDYYERTLFNHRLGTIHPETGATQYYLSLTPGTWKTFNTEYDSFWCCTGTGVEEYSKLNDSIYWRDDAGLYINLFIASELNWEEKGFKLRQDTKFPEQPGTAFVVTAAKPLKMAVRIRIPEWVNGGAVRINGKPLEAVAGPGSYLAISREWKTGDRVEVDLPMTLRVEKMPDDPTLQAFLYGPVVLAGELGSAGLMPDMLVGPNAPPIDRAPSIQIPVFKAAGDDPSSWIKPVAGRPLAFRTAGQAKDVSLVPLNSIFGQRYSVYWRVI
jgi:DUF1680 family protein